MIAKIIIINICRKQYLQEDMGVKLAEIVIDSLLKVQLFCATVCWGNAARYTGQRAVAV